MAGEDEVLSVAGGVASPPVAAPEPAASAPVAVAPAVVAPAEAAPAAAAESGDGIGPTLLQEFDAQRKDNPDAPKPEEKPADGAKPVEGAKPAEAKPDGAAAPIEGQPQPTGWDYKIPDTIKLDDVERTKVNGLFDALRADPAKGAQGLVDYYAQKTGEFAAQTAKDQSKRQWDTWRDTQKTWRSQVMADPDIGGSALQTSLGVMARVRDMGVKAADREEFNKMLVTTGVGNHPQFIKMMVNLGRFYDEASLPPPGARPTKTNGAPPGRKTLRDVYRDTQAGRN